MRLQLKLGLCQRAVMSSLTRRDKPSNGAPVPCCPNWMTWSRRNPEKFKTARMPSSATNGEGDSVGELNVLRLRHCLSEGFVRVEVWRGSCRNPSPVCKCTPK